MPTRAKLLVQKDSKIWQEFLDAIPDLILINDDDSRIVWANKAFLDYYGLGLEELRNKVDSEFSDPHLKKNIEKTIERFSLLLNPYWYPKNLSPDTMVLLDILKR